MSSGRIVKMLDPLNLTPEENSQLASFLKNTKDDFISNTQVYSTPSFEAFQLKYSLLKRACVSKKNEGQHRFEILTRDRIGEGGMCTGVYKIASTIAIESSNALKIKKNKPRVVKYVNNCSRQGVKEFVLREFDLTKQAGHMHIKPPVFFGRDSLTVMRRQPGRELFDILKDLIEGRLRLSIDIRLKLTLALLHAMKNQVHDRLLVHRDIKPENILVDFSYDAAGNINGVNAVNILDFGLSKRTEEKSTEAYGSPHYVAPEVVDGKEADARSDFFGLSLALGILWNALPCAHQTNNLDDILAMQKSYNFPDLFRGMGEVFGNLEHERSIRDTLLTMHQYEREQRPQSLDKIIPVFEKIADELPEAQKIVAGTIRPIGF
jgi:serine/threonine protein kinase